ncbi:MAG: undecaprenyl-diphosphate phosphatase [Acidobacteriaceae bacterium]
MLHLWQTIILGVIEGLTEFLPISSTGHLILAGKLLSVPDSDFYKTFEIVIQLGAIASVVVIYWKFLWGNIKFWPKLIAAFIPTGLIGFFVYPLLKSRLLGNESVVLWALLIGGIIIIVFEMTWGKKIENAGQEVKNITYPQALLIGLFQSIAIVPGVSRAAATIIGGLALKIERRAIVEFSFLLAIPTMVAASGYDLYKSAHAFSSSQFTTLAIGFVAAFIVAIIAVKGFLKFVQSKSFTSFGIYRIALALAFWFLIR